MKVLQFVGLQFFEVTYLGILALLPFIVVQQYFVGFLLLFAALSGCYYVIKTVTSGQIQVKGQGVLITGCDTGFGHVLAKRLETMGFTVFAGCYIENGEGAEALKASTTGRLHVLHLDVTKENSVKNALSFVSEHITESTGFWGIVNNAGLNFIGDVELCTMEMYSRVMEVNVFGMVRVTKAFLPLIRKSKGRVLNVTSVQGRLTMPSHSVYGITKSGGEAFSDALRLEMIKFGVKVSLIEPGNFGGATGMLNKMSLQRMKKDFDTMWAEASEDVKETYGENYTQTQYNNATQISGTSCPTLAPVIDGMVHALTSVSPKPRYLIGGGKHFFDIYCFLARLNAILPSAVMDVLLDKIFAAGIPIKSTINQ